MTMQFTIEEYNQIISTMGEKPERLSPQARVIGDGAISVMITENEIIETMDATFATDFVQLECVKKLIEELKSMYDDMLKDPAAKQEIEALASKFGINTNE